MHKKYISTKERTKNSIFSEITLKRTNQESDICVTSDSSAIHLIPKPYPHFGFDDDHSRK